MTPSSALADNAAGHRTFRLLTIAEWVVAVGLTLHLLFLHVQNWLEAPMLWRDELTTLHIATRPSLGEAWSLTEWESLPLLWPLVLRTWVDLGLGEHAESLRALALALGILILLGFFLALQVVARTPPLLTLLLVAANPAVIRYGDTIRGYGLGLFLAILLVVAYWRLALRVDRSRTLIAAALSILAVQCLYHDAVIVLALATACSAAWVSRRALRQALVPLAIGATTALTLIPYLGPLARAQEWNILFRMEVTLRWLLRMLRHAVELDGPWLSYLWALTVILAFAALLYRLLRPGQDPAVAVEQRARVVFFAVALVLSVAGYVTFLVQVGYPTQVWYYVTLLGVVGVLLEASLAFGAGTAIVWRVGRIAVVLAALALVVPGLAQRFPQRLTNMDLVADILEERAGPDDLIIVNPWYLGISFDHYYAGRTPWHSIPDVSDRKLTRYDLVKEVMARPDGTEPIADRVQETLEARRRVWVVGDLPLASGNPPPKPVPIAPSPELGWSEAEYLGRWSRVVGHRIQQFANRRSDVAIGATVLVGPFERPRLQVFEVVP